MNIRDVNNVCIVDIAGKALSQSDISELRKIYKENSDSKRIGLNFEHIKAIEPEFLSLIKDAAEKNKLSVFNAQCDIYLQLFISKTDEFLNLYLNEGDFCEEKRSIVKRRLKLLKSA